MNVVSEEERDVKDLPRLCEVNALGKVYYARRRCTLILGLLCLGAGIFQVLYIRPCSFFQSNSAKSSEGCDGFRKHIEAAITIGHLMSLFLSGVLLVGTYMNISILILNWVIYDFISITLVATFTLLKYHRNTMAITGISMDATSCMTYLLIHVSAIANAYSFYYDIICPMSRVPKYMETLENDSFDHHDIPPL